MMRRLRWGFHDLTSKILAKLSTWFAEMAKAESNRADEIQFGVRR